MKAIIDGKIYDTEKAVVLAQRADYPNWGTAMRTLYKTPKGAYFFHCTEREPFTESPRAESILPLSSQEALSWMQENTLLDLIAREFPDKMPKEA